MKQIRKRLTYANVMSSIAVFMVLGGATAFAATKIGANEIKANSIKTGKIVKEAVTAGKIKNSAVTTGKLANAGVTADKIADNAVTTTKIADKAVTAVKINLTGLPPVPNATNATNAENAKNAENADFVNGQLVVPFFEEMPDNGAAVTIVEVDGVKLTGTCTAGTPAISATKTSPLEATARKGTIEETTVVHGNGQSSFSTLALTNGNQLGSGTLEVAFEDGLVASVDFAWRDDAFNGNGCRFFGHAISG